MPLLARLELPRFYVNGDETVVSAVVHNYTGIEREVHVRLQASGATVLDADARTITLPASGQQRVDWRATIGSATTNNAGTARILVVADGGEGAKDATEQTLPVLAAGLKEVDAKADSIAMQEGSYRLNLASLPPGASVTLSLSPSIASATFDALDELTTFPYGCAEQTTSSFLPDVIVARTLKRLGVQRAVHPNLDQWVNLGLQKLYRYQHADGGWNWWEFDQTDGDMTSYVLWALLQAKAAGYLVDEQRIARGTDSLLRQLSQERDFARRVDWLLTLTTANPARVKGELQKAYKDREKLDTHALASLVLALQAATPATQRPNGQTVQATTELESKAKVVGTTAYWPAEEGGYSWRDSDVEVTAHALRALLAVKQESSLVQPAVRWLMGNRQGRGWDTSRAGAEAVYALASYMERSKELNPDYRARVLLDGDEIRALSATRADVFASPVTLTVPAERLRGHTNLTVEKSGAGTLYITALISHTTTAANAKPVARGVTVRRTYRITAADPSLADSVASGTEMAVDVEIIADANYRYAILEEPIPAGCEVQGTDDPGGRFALDADESSLCVRQEVRDDRVVFFFDSLPKGPTHLTYRLHAQTPGRYQILPALGWLMYFPEIRGNTGLVTAQITEARP